MGTVMSTRCNLFAQECDVCNCLFIPGGKGTELSCGTCIKERMMRMEKALRSITEQEHTATPGQLREIARNALEEK